MNIRLFSFLLILILAVAPLAAAGEDSVDGAWKKMRHNPQQGDNIIRIDLEKKVVVLSHAGYGRMELKVLDAVKDMKTDLPRYTLTVEGRAGRFSLTVVRLGDNKVYIGGGRPGWKIWGTYQPAGN